MYRTGLFVNVNTQQCTLSSSCNPFGKQKQRELFCTNFDLPFVLVFSGGPLCPNSSSLQEVRNCNEHACTVYHWQTGPWGPCTEDPSASSLNTSISVRGGSDGQGPCSLGMQTRKVICVRVNVGQVPPKK